MAVHTTDERFPALPLEAWEPTKDTLHLYLQIVGKIRLKLAPRRNHWWHVPYYVTTTGLTTTPMPYGDRTLNFDFDFNDHKLIITTDRAERQEIALYDGLTVADYYRAVFDALDELGIQVTILARPFDHPSSTIPFARDTVHHHYDAPYVWRCWRVISGIDAVLKRFAARFQGKASPVHVFWHSFDIAVTFFNGRRGPDVSAADPVTQDAYSHEVISFGFWAGDKRVPAPALYAYVYPEPEDLTRHPLRPAAAKWDDTGRGHLALLLYEHARQAADPEAAMLDFLASAYAAGVEAAGWDAEAFAYPHAP